MNFDVNEIITLLSTKGVDLGTKIVAAIAFWVIGRWIINKVKSLIQFTFTRNKIDHTLAKYTISIIGVVLNVLLIVGILGYFGIETTSLAALLAGVGIAIGTAWGGLLSNFAAGAFLLILRPFKVGEVVTVGGITGEVRELGIFGTSIVTGDNVLTTIGNNKIFSGDILNFSKLPVRRVDRTALIAGSVDPMMAIEKLRKAVAAINNVSNEPAPDVFILDFTPAGTVLAVRPYTNNVYYAQVYADTNAMIVRVNKEEGWPPAAPLQFVKQV